MKRFLVFLFLLVLFRPGSVVGQSGDVRPVDIKELKQCIRTLASDEFEGRGTGEPGQVKAAEYLNGEFARSGVLPLVGESFLVDFPLYIRYREECYIKHGKKILCDFEDMFCSGIRYSQNREVEKEVVFGGDGDTAVLNQMDLRGKIVAFFIPNLRNTISISDYLAEKGAYGAFYANPENLLQYASVSETTKEHILEKSYSRDSLERVTTFDTRTRSFVSKFIGERTYLGEFQFKASVLAELFGKTVSSLKKAIRNGEITEIPTVNVQALCRRESVCKVVSNVAGIIRGRVDSTLVITAHYDHLGKKDGVIYPGADDNASGVAAMLQMMRNISADKKVPHYNVVFVAVTGEEVGGFLGTNYFLDSTAVGMNIVGNINLDMLGRSDDFNLSDQGKCLYAIGNTEDVLFRPLWERLADPCAVLVDGKSNELLSDHVVFMKRGIPVLFLTTGDHADYHQPTDVWNKIDYNSLKRCTKFACELVRGLIF